MRVETFDTYGNDPDTCLDSSIKQGFEGEDALGAEIPGGTLDECPVEVDGDGVETESPDLLKNVQPQRRRGKSIVKFISFLLSTKLLSSSSRVQKGTYRKG